MPYKVQLATNDDAAALALLRNAVADHLTSQHGRGPWSGHGTEKGVLYAMRTSRVFVARERSEIVATLHPPRCLCRGRRRRWFLRRMRLRRSRRVMYRKTPLIRDEILS
jgi:hypothetical protein